MVKKTTSCYFYVTIIIIITLLPVFCNCYDVIIIGAGASGIAAGMYLLNHGIDNFVILEAENRIGGRINSIKFGESFVDLGAEWCLGEQNNKVHSIATDYQLLKPVNVNYKFISSDLVDFTMPTGNELLECRKSFSNNLLEIPTVKDNATLNDAFLKYSIDKIISKFVAIDSNSEKFFMEALQVLSSMVLTHESFYSWDKIPAKPNYQKCIGQLKHFDGLGFQVLLKIMMNEFPNSEEHTIRSKIRYESDVHRIIWKQENTSEVIVKSTKGDYTAKHVIFTPSLGVLKNIHSTLFEPGLPQNKINGVNCLGFEGTMKVFLKYSKPWWIGEFNPTLLVWRNEESSYLKKWFFRKRYFYQAAEPLHYRDPWIFALTQVLPSPNNPNVIEAWFTGEMAKGIETFPDEVLVDGIMLSFVFFFSNPTININRPDSILRTYWNTNPHFLGSHSYETRRPSPFAGSCNVDLAVPLYRNNTPVVLFAGEATSKHHYSTVHGAIEAGEREAYRLITRTPLITGNKVTCFKI